MYSNNEYCEEISRFTEKLILDRGYPLEVHSVTTEDGYINSIYRINKTTAQSKQKNPVLIVHGLMSSIGDSVMEENSLGYYLADNGFDVWIASCRGTTYSRGHVKYDHTKDLKEYWDFSFHEMGYFDLPAFIDHVLKKTEYAKLFYIGVSQGCTAFTVLMSTRPQYNEKIALACLLCPAVKFKHAKSWQARFHFCYFVPFLKWTSELFNRPFYELWITQSIRKFGLNHAKKDSVWRSVFIGVLNNTAGFANPDQIHPDDFTNVCRTTPNTAAFKQFLHYSQVLSTNRLAHYDYGPSENLRLYSSEIPPLYDLSKVTAPSAVFYSNNDIFYGEQDIEALTHELGNCVHQYLVKQDKFNHMNFIFHQDIIPLLYSHVLNVMNDYIS